jgi:hypothetical protein
MEVIKTRDTLIDALNQAAELEHLLCCSYLFAGFSIKKSPDETLQLVQTEQTREWATQIMLIARQEMEHLGMACNLLSAVGASPNFSRANFPQPAGYLPVDLPSELSRFSLDTVERFIQFEKPDWPGQVSSQVEQRQTSEEAFIPYSSLQELYEEIRQGFINLDEQLGAEVLFIGPTEAQITNQTLFDQTAKGYQINLQGVLAKDPKDRLKEAVAMIDQIIAEGEGAPTSSAGSHYARFVNIKEQYQALLSENPSFNPAKPVADNPQTFKHPSGGQGTVISNPLTLQVAQLFNLVYETMLLLMIRFYAHTDETPTELTALQEIAFFPLMTMGIRPLGEVLTEMPIDDGTSGLCAGPPFELERPLHFLPHKEAAWRILQELLDRTGAEAEALAELARMMQSPVAERLHFISLSLKRNAENFGAYVHGKENI